jgi:hypothetical protein
VVIIKAKTGLLNGLATAIRFLSFLFGNPAIPAGPVAFRPTIARGLALSAIYLLFPFNLIVSKSYAKESTIK